MGDVRAVAAVVGFHLHQVVGDELRQQNTAAAQQALGEELALADLGLALGIDLLGKTFRPDLFAVVFPLGVVVADPPDAGTRGPLEQSSVFTVFSAHDRYFVKLHVVPIENEPNYLILFGTNIEVGWIFEIQNVVTADLDRLAVLVFPFQNVQAVIQLLAQVYRTRDTKLHHRPPLECYTDAGGPVGPVRCRAGFPGCVRQLDERRVDANQRSARVIKTEEPEILERQFSILGSGPDVKTVHAAEVELYEMRFQSNRDFNRDQVIPGPQGRPANQHHV